MLKLSHPNHQTQLENNIIGDYNVNGEVWFILELNFIFTNTTHPIIYTLAGFESAVDLLATHSSASEIVI